MYDIDKFFNEKISLNFDTEEEARVFSAECEAKRIGNFDIMLRYDIRTDAFVCNWDNQVYGGIKDTTINRILRGKDKYHVENGWKSMRASELIIDNIVPSKAALMEFLGGE